MFLNLNKAPPTSGKSEQELQEEEELHLALALSQSDAENKVKEVLLHFIVLLGL